jgi:trehalose 6-phosphate phosphatase
MSILYGEFMDLSLHRGDALLLDFDGTLVDIACVPDAIELPPDLQPLLRLLSADLNFPVCIVSGRSLNDLKKFVSAPVDLAGEHGGDCEISKQRMTICNPWPSQWEATLSESEARFAGLVVERKKTSVALHYRLNPALEQTAVAIAELLCASGVGYNFVVAEFTVEVKQSHIDKGKAIEFLMNCDKYAGKRPVFIADSLMDEPGFHSVMTMGGIALRVGDQFNGKPKEVRSWLSDEARRFS